jgi:hypothetical protein
MVWVGELGRITYVHACMHTYVYTYIDAYTYTHTHTHGYTHTRAGCTLSLRMLVLLPNLVVVRLVD